MATFQTKEFTQSQLEKGRTQEEISSFLIGKGINPGLPEEQIAGKGEINFFKRLRLSFGDTEARRKIKTLERQAGLRGKFDIGDIADIVGEIPSLIGFIGGAAAGTIVGPAGTVVGAGVGAGVGEAARQAIGRVIGVREEFEPVEVAEEAVFGAAAGLLGPVLKLAAKPAKVIFKPLIISVKKLTGLIGRKTSQLAFGARGTSGIIQRFRKPQEVSEFLKTVRGKQFGKDVETVVTEVRNSAIKVRKLANKAFQAAEKKLVSKPISQKAVKNESFTIIKDFLRIPTVTKNNINKAIGLRKVEKKVLNDIASRISKIKKPNTKIVLDLKRDISLGFRGTKNTARSDALVTRINNHLNSLIEKTDPIFRQASKNFAENRAFLEKIGINITGTNKLNVEQTSRRLLQLARDLDNPFKREASESLLRELGQRTGIDFVNTLQSLQSAERLGVGEGIRAGVVREFARILEIMVSGTAGFLGRGRELIKGVVTEITPLQKGVAGFVKQFGRVGAFEAMKIIEEQER